MTTQDKIDGADRIELVIPDGFDVAQCQPLRERPVWRIENGQAVCVVYDLYRGPGGEIPDINGVLPRSEFGVEIHIAVAFLTFIIGISLDKVCGLMKLFWKLDLSKSQADALLNQLARLWEPEFESELLSNLVHELVRLLGEDELFTFVLHPEATGTNNEAERSLRGAGPPHGPNEQNTRRRPSRHDSGERSGIVATASPAVPSVERSVGSHGLGEMRRKSVHSATEKFGTGPAGNIQAVPTGSQN